ncbi:MAG: glycosyltransferase family 2 protein [bacterium]
MIKKLVSVIIPAYNCENYLCRSLESGLNQTYRDIEIIVIDDGSRDNTKGLVQYYINMSSKIRYIYQRNKGPAAARNRGIEIARGEYFAFLDADDWWDKEKLDKTIGFINGYNFDWVCTAMTKMTRDGRRVTKRIPGDSWAINLATKELNLLKNGLFFFSSIAINIQTIVARRSCFEKVGLFDETFFIGEDTDIWLRFEENNLRGGYLDECLTTYGYNEKGLTRDHKRDGLQENARVAKKHAMILGLSNDVIRRSYSDFLWRVADIYYANKRYIRSIKYIIQSLFYNPKHMSRIIKKRVNFF